MLRRMALSQHKHTGKILEHHHTSYLPLGVLLFVVGIVLSVYTSLEVVAQHPPPVASSIGLHGTVPAPPPDQAPTITTPSANRHFSKSPTTVAGTCGNGMVIQVFKNDIFAGSVLCENNKFSFEIDLLYGKNTLLARAYDALNQSSPESNKVVVFYDASANLPDGVTGIDFGGAQLLLSTNAVYRGVYPGKEMTLPISILGGQAPYALQVQWGDSTDSLISRNSATTFRTTHTYTKGGIYQMSIKATDANGRVAFISVAAIVNGQPEEAIALATDSNNSGTSFTLLLSLWPLYVAIIVIVLSYWLGERREKHVLENRGLLLPQNYPYNTAHHNKL